MSTRTITPELRALAIETQRPGFRELDFARKPRALRRSFWLYFWRPQGLPWTGYPLGPHPSGFNRAQRRRLKALYS